MKKYVFQVVVEPDEGRWSAHCPALAAQGAATWGETREEALRHIQEVVQIIVNELIEDGESVPKEVEGSAEPLVAVTA
jgi:predicted RNase H-like HicB family nuclease